MAGTIYERRQALRVQLRSHSNVSISGGARSAHLLNLSETGALVAVLEPNDLTAGTPLTLEVELDEGKILKMEGHVAHVKEHMLGLECRPASDADAAGLQALIDQLAPQMQA